MKHGFWAAFAARGLLILLLFVVFVAAVFIAGASLHDPDTCWLLALGKRIVESSALPHSDPYSYTMALFPERKFILYQWLTEVLFYLSYKAMDLTGLLLLAATVLTAAFVSLPLSFARKIGMPGTFAVVGTILTLMTAFFHFLCRPEIFSYLLLVVYISMTHYLLRGRKNEKINFPAVTAFGAVMLLWCNLHSAFVLGLLYLFVFTLVTTLADFIADKRLSAQNQTIILCFVVAFLCTFTNPYGVGLWQYLPTLFFTPLNKHILELRPIAGKDFLEWTYYPFFILLGSTLLFTARALKAKINPALVGSPRGQVVFAAIAIICWGIAGFCSRRLIPFAAVHMFAEGGYLLALLRAKSEADRASNQVRQLEAEQDSAGQDSAGQDSAKQEGAKQDGAEHDSAQSFWQSVDRKLDASYQPQGFMWFVTIAVLAGIGVYFVSSRIPEAVVLPQSGGAFKAPFKAIEAIEKAKPQGNLFNHPQFGDVMIWKMPEPPKLFIDTRFDMYGAEIVDNYQTLYAAKPGWEHLMQRYKIAWIFVQPDAPIAKSLLAKQGWTVLYEDKASVVLQNSSALKLNSSNSSKSQKSVAEE